MGENIVSELMRSKTSGAGKRVRELPVSVWGGCNLAGQLWIEQGLELLTDSGDQARDYLLRKPTADLGDWKDGMASFADSAALSVELFKRIKTPVYNDLSRSWSQGAEVLVDKRIAHFWTEHSPRNFLPSVLIQLEVGKEKRDMLGRWSPSGSDDYIRTYRSTVLGLQKQATDHIKQADDRLDESDVLDRLGRFGRDRLGLEQDQVEGLVKQLRGRMESFWKQLKASSSDHIPSPAVSLLTLPHTSAQICTTLPTVEQVVRPLGAAKARFVLVFGRNRKFVRLHKASGNCPWPFITLADSMEVDKVEPHMYSARCKICWPELAANRKVESNDEDSDSCTE